MWKIFWMILKKEYQGLKMLNKKEGENGNIKSKADIKFNT